MQTQQVLIKKLSSDMAQEWDAYVMAHPEGTFFHLSKWKDVIERAYGHETCYLMAVKNNEIVGLLPLGYIRSRLFGNALISNPFCVYGGAIANTAPVRIQLESFAEEVAVNKEVDYLELRNREADGSNWPVKELYVTFRKEIDPDPEVNMRAIPRKQRAMVRKGIKANLSTIIHDEIDTFFKIYSTSVRNHGTPVFPKRYFSILKDVFSDMCELRVVYRRGRAISSVMSFYFRDEVLPYYGGGLTEARQYKAFDFMYWDLLQDSCQQGVRIFDYGRSKINTGSYSFKKNWGFEPASLPYKIRLVKSKNIPDINPLNPKYQLFIKAWRHLPLSIANVLGPQISRNLG